MHLTNRDRSLRSETLWLVVIFVGIIEKGATQNCTAFPEDVTVCSDLSLQCSAGFAVRPKNALVTIEAFPIGNSSNPSTSDFATCLLNEACHGHPTCDVIDMVLMEMEAVICRDICYHITIPHDSCQVGSVDSHMTTFVMRMDTDHQKIKIKRYSFATADAIVSDVVVTPQCEGPNAVPISTCEIDFSCHGPNIPGRVAVTVIQKFEPGDNITLDLKEEGAEKGLTMSVDAPSFSDQEVTVQAVLFEPNEPFQEVTGDSDGVTLKLGSAVLDIEFLDENDTHLTLKDGETISLTFQSSSSLPYGTTTCAYFVEDTDMWSTYGCYPSSVQSTTVTCTCNHTTSFAVLLQFEDCIIEGSNLNAQTLITRFLNGISVCALFLTIVIFIFFRLYSSDQVKVHISLAISLGLAQIVMLFMDQTQNEKLCTAIAVTAHYLLSVYCVAMLQEGILLFRKASRTQKPPAKGWVLVLTSWGIPAVLVAVMMVVFRKGYGSACVCWLGVRERTMWVWLAEVCLVVMVNTVLLYSIMRTFVSLKANAKKTEMEKFKTTVRAVLIMIPMLGMTWFFGMLQALTKNIFMQYMFIVINALQGPMFFIFQCVMHPEVQKVLGRKRSKVSDMWARNTSSSPDSGVTLSTTGELSLGTKFGKAN